MTTPPDRVPSRRRIALAATLAAAVLLTALPASAQSTEPVAAPQAEQAMMQLVNAHRVSVGLGPLISQPRLVGLARAQAARMLRKGDIYHNPNLRSEATAALPAWELVGENVGVGVSPESIQRAFLRSPSHRRNIENRRYNLGGIGAVSTADGLIFVTQLFALAPVPKDVAPAVTQAIGGRTAPAGAAFSASGHGGTVSVPRRATGYEYRTQEEALAALATLFQPKDGGARVTAGKTEARTLATQLSRSGSPTKAKRPKGGLPGLLHRLKFWSR
ncbi:MAG TPA: CAP domain-containing protein [Actinomycetota bacterium]|nr:CAP domain-containing protein [Actinomycetota bacterium]